MSNDRFFGKRWDAPAFDELTEAPTPVGEECPFCDEVFIEGDRGLWMGWNGYERPVHLECLLRSTLGSPAHQLGICSCSGGEEPVDKRSWREQGQEVMRMIQEGEGIWARV